MFKWINVNEAVPDNEYVVLVVASGKPKENIILIEALQLACFDKNEGWILEEWPEAENIEIHYWAYIPEHPEVKG